jgi:tetratricopeptide (TPR) repeat protein
MSAMPLGHAEQQLVTVVVGAPGATAGPAAGLEATMLPAPALRQKLEPIARRHGARLEVLPDGSAIAVAHVPGAPAEQALRAARFAVALREAAPGGPIAIATGRSVVELSLPVGEAIDRAVGAVRRAAAGEIVLDEPTMRLIEARFELSASDGEAGAWRLGPERGLAGAVTFTGERRVTFVGRRRELGLLETTFEECVAEPCARAVLVTGEGGMGKSRLCQELMGALLVAEHAGLEVMVARADPMTSGSAFAMIAPAIRAICGVDDAEPIDGQRERLRARVGAHVAGPDATAVAELLGEIAGVPFPDDASPRLRAARSDPMLMSEQTRTAFLDWLGAECAAGPRVIVLEDLHWADGSTVQLLDAALDLLARSPLLVVALARPAVHETFPRLWEDRDITKLELAKLTRGAAAELVGALAPSIPKERVDELIARADGNPYFLEELVRAVRAGRGDALPETVLGTVSARIDALDPAARRVLRAASVFGERFWKGGVEALLDADRAGLDVAAWLAALAAQGILVPARTSRFTDEPELAFRHSLLREASYAMLTDSDRTSGHRRAGRWLEDNGEDDAAALVEHFDRGQDLDRVARWCVPAARAALQGNDLAGTLRFADRGLVAGATGERRALLLLHQGDAQVWLGEPAPARVAAEEALGLLEPGTPGWFAAVGLLADACMNVGDATSLLPHVEALLSQSLPPDHPHGPALAALARIALALVVLGSVPMAIAAMAYADGLQHQTTADDPTVMGRLAHARAAVAVADHDLEHALHWFMQAADAYDRGGALRLASGSRTCAGAMCIELGGNDRAMELVRPALAQAERIGSRYLVALAKVNLGIAASRAARIGEGIALATDAAAAFATQGDVRLEASTLAALAEMRLQQSDYAEAVVVAERAVLVATALPASQAAARAVAAAACLAAGRADAAATHARVGMAILATTPMDEREALLRVVYAESLAASGDHVAAQSAIAEAQRRLLERSARIADAELRRSFLEAVPENARTFAVAAALGVER